MKLRPARAALAIAAALVAASAQSAAPRTHSYLRIDGVLGASTDPNHYGWFEVVGWGPARLTSDGGATARIHLVGEPPSDLAAAVSGRKTLHEALLQDIAGRDGALVRTVSFRGLVLADLQPGAGRTYAVTVRATKAVCRELTPPSDVGPCAALQKRP